MGGSFCCFDISKKDKGKRLIKLSPLIYLTEMYCVRFCIEFKFFQEKSSGCTDGQSWIVCLKHPSLLFQLKHKAWGQMKTCLQGTWKDKSLCVCACGSVFLT